LIKQFDLKSSTVSLAATPAVTCCAAAAAAAG